MLSLIAVLVCQAASAARSAPPSSAPPRVVFSVSIERRDEHVRYHFTDASSFDTTTLVPHFFEQRYDASNTWISVAADYRLADAAARTEVALTPRVTTAGSDLDTFFNPSGDVIVSGTDGLVSLGSVALSERLGITTWRGWTLGVTVGYRRSRADFPPDVVVVTHTIPPSTMRTVTSDPETTISQVVESGFIGDAHWRLGGAWHLSASNRRASNHARRADGVAPRQVPRRRHDGGRLCVRRPWPARNRTGLPARHGRGGRDVQRRLEL